MLLERESALDSLHAALRSARLGQGQVVIAAGEAGIGKSALLRAFAASQQAGRMHWGGCEALFTPRPLGPLRDMAAGLDARIAGLLDERAAQDRIFPALLAALQDSRELPILVFEDVHWADRATLDLIRYLGRRIAYVRALLILSLRTDEVGAGHPLLEVLGDLPAVAVRRVSLGPLSAKAVETLSALPARDAAEIHRAAGGNPFFVTELLANADQSAGQLPHSVRDAVWARLQRLRPEHLAFLESISIEPGGVEPRFAAELYGPESTAAASECLARGLLLRGAEGHLRFRHELARAATLERLSGAARVALHRRALEILSAREGASLARLLHHAEGADDAHKVLTLAPRAAAEAARLGAHREAAAHLAAALRYEAEAPPWLRAELLEDWSHEAGLALEITPDTITARKKAIDIWLSLGRKEKVVHNLRWISRLHWLRGEQEPKQEYLERAVALAAELPPSPEVAMTLSAQSQFYLINDYCPQAIAAGQRALDMAVELGDIDTRIHALNNVGSARLFSGDEGGGALLEESIALALEHGFHEHAARGYTNYTGYAIDHRKFAIAERIAPAGIAFTVKHDLDAEMQYLLGLQSELLLEQGRYAEAEATAVSVTQASHVTLVCRFPASAVVAKIQMRRGAPEALAMLNDCLSDAVTTGELQNIVPARFALAEHRWLAGDIESCQREVQAIAGLRIEDFDGWKAGELTVWWKRATLPGPAPTAGAALAAPYAAEAAGDVRHASRLWLDIGSPYEAAFALAQTPETIADAISLAATIDAPALVRICRERAKAWGVKIPLRGKPRGRYGDARSHPLGLTRRELQVLAHLAEGAANAEIAHRLSLSPRTVEQHVSSLISKMGTDSRMGVVVRLRNEPWLLASQNDAARRAVEN